MKKFLLFIITIGSIVSCQKEDIFEFEQREALGLVILPDSLSWTPPGNPIVYPLLDINISLGAKLENPYSVTNMRIAYNDDTIRPKLAAAGIDEEDINTTHFYVKFQPDNEEELQLLKQRYANYDIYEYPLDYEISGRISYHDPSLPDTVPTYQYMSIDSLSWNTISRPENVDFEILERLYIPDEDIDIETSARTLASSTMTYEEAIEALVNKSLALTGNLEDEEIDENGTMGSNTKWYPSGRITAYDDIVDGQVPLKGVKVRARRWFTTYTAITDENGYFACSNGFKRQANYSIVWEGDMWDIRDGYIVQAYYNGPKKSGAWNLEIPKNAENNKSLRYAAIHRAVYRMMEGNTYGLSRPTCRQIISYVADGGTDYGTYFCELGLGVFCDIRIRGKNEENEWFKPHEIIATAFHELGHAAHFTNNIIGYPLSQRVIQESWANFIGYYLVLNEYQDLGFQHGPFEIKTYTDNEQYQSVVYYIPDDIINYQLIKINSDKRYTPLFIDLHDSNNQHITNVKHDTNNITNQQYYPHDEVRAISASTLENIVFASFSISNIKNKLIDYYSLIGEPNNHNLTPQTINDLFELYETYY